jgi:hypothetical protein
LSPARGLDHWVSTKWCETTLSQAQLLHMCFL